MPRFVQLLTNIAPCMIYVRYRHLLFLFPPLLSECFRIHNYTQDLLIRQLVNVFIHTKQGKVQSFYVFSICAVLIGTNEVYPIQQEI